MGRASRDPPVADAPADRVRLGTQTTSGRDRVPGRGERHLRHAIEQYLEHYHVERNHQGIGTKLIDSEVSAVGEIECRERLGGLLEYDYRAA
jgi:hypothetical protein